MDGTVDFLLETVGPGTRRLAELCPGDGLWLAGPLGIGFREPPAGSRPLLVGGGIGTAPLFCLQDELGEGAEAHVCVVTITMPSRITWASRACPRTIGRAVRIYTPSASLSKNTWPFRPFGGFYTAPSGIRLSRISYYRRWYS